MIQRVECPRPVVAHRFYDFRRLPQCLLFVKLTLLLHYSQGLALREVGHG